MAAAAGCQPHGRLLEIVAVYTGKHAITDLELRYSPKRAPQFAIGVQNLFDVYPNKEPASLNGASGLVGFPFYSPFGFNGRYLYGRVTVNFR